MEILAMASRIPARTTALRKFNRSIGPSRRRGPRNLVMVLYQEGRTSEASKAPGWTKSKLMTRFGMVDVDLHIPDFRATT
jgi:hypothetical protein